MGRTFSITLCALVMATAAGGCGSNPHAEDLQKAQQAATQVADFCAAARANIAANEPLQALAAEGGAPRPAEEIAVVVDPVRESNAALLQMAPVEVRPDTEAALALADLRLAAFEASRGDAAVALQDPAYVAKARQVQASIDRLQLFFRTTCGIDVD